MAQLRFFNEEDDRSFPGHLLGYYPGFITEERARALLEQLRGNTAWQQQSIRMYGKIVQTPRLTSWYGDEGSSYTFSGTRFDPLHWSPELAALRREISAFTGLPFNSVLLNYYRDGNDSVAWHSDDEPELGEQPQIASLSLGQARTFDFRHRQDHRNKHRLLLTNGSLLVMKGGLQRDWEHCVPKSARPMQPRINLTFRMIH